MSLKIEFVERASKRGINMSALCREYGISRETGHKWLRRFKAGSYDALEEKSRRPTSTPAATGEEVVMAVLTAREAHPRWGPKKLLEIVRRRLGEDTPSRATIARILRRFGMVRSRRHRAQLSIVERAPTVDAKACNEVWSVDFKGWWLAHDRSRSEPLTVRDAFSRFVLSTKLLEAKTIELTRSEFERLFRRYGVPDAIQCDNGEPFICTQSRGGLTRLSAWWISLGIRIVRSRPACPQDNGGHERMHRDISDDVQSSPRLNRIQEQRALDRWRQEFNHVRPHEALDGKTPAELYEPGKRRSLRAVRWTYPDGWLVKRVYGPNGLFAHHAEEIPVGRAFVGHHVALEPRSDLTMRMWFHDIDLGDAKLPLATALVDAACVKFMKGTTRRKKAA